MIKLVIWDLDDTLWRGTLADGDTVELFEHRAELIRALNRRGVVSAICSKNDFATAQAKLVELGLWDEFVFPHIAFTPKPAAIRQIIEDMQLRPANVLFVDDNPINLNETRFTLPEINILDITQPDADAYLAEVLAAQTGTRSRVAEYRILEQKKRDRVEGGTLSNEEFLRTCGIKACTPYEMENLDFADRISELVNRSNQLNYTQSRLTPEEVRDLIIDVVTYSTWSVFAWDKYGDYGLVGFVVVKKNRPGYALLHFVFSCRAMHMGLEQFVLEKAFDRARILQPDINVDTDVAQWEGRFSRTSPDWIEDAPFPDPAVAARMRSLQKLDIAAAPLIRIMANCQSAGIAHYSDYRSIMEFDSYPRVFSMNRFHFRAGEDQDYPPYLVYHAGADYLNTPWGEMAKYLEDGFYVWAAEKFCQQVIEKQLKLLVILPSEELPTEKYAPWEGLVPFRVRMFNDLWRRAHHALPGISVIEMAQVHGHEEMKDVNHHHPNSLRMIANLVDSWFEQVAPGSAVDNVASLAA